jgi:hypothetical protein
VPYFEILQCNFCTFCFTFDFGNRSVGAESKRLVLQRLQVGIVYVVLVIFARIFFLPQSWSSIEKGLFLRKCDWRSSGISGMNSFVV